MVHEHSRLRGRGGRAARRAAMALLLAGLAVLWGCGPKEPKSARDRRAGESAGGAAAATSGAGSGSGPGGSAAGSPAAEWKVGTHGAWSAIPAGEPLNLLLITLDTTRRDHLSCYGFSKPTTPNLDRLAADGVLFEDPYTPVPVTLAAHSTMMTGLLPFQHGVRDNGSFVLPQDRTTLAELLKKHGYGTGAILGSFAVDHRFGLDQGFDEYDDRFPPSSVLHEGDTAQRIGADVTRLSLAWIDTHKDHPFFLWSHYFDAHAPYHPPEPFQSRFAGDPYSGEIGYMDACIGDLINGLRTRGLLERTVILVAGDHGEGLGEHGERTHTTFIYGATQRVPMIFRFPNTTPFDEKTWRGRKIPGLVDLADLLPSAWNALALPREELPPLAGKSLLPVIQGSDGPHPWVYHETLVPEVDYGASDLRGLQDERWKYIRAPRPELYDLKSDPGELHNLASREKERTASMEADLQKLLQDEKGLVAQKAMDQETIEKLKSLGYLGGAVTTGTSGPRPDPKDIAWVEKVLADAQTRAAQHRTERALAMVDSVLAAYPRTKLAERLRANYLERLGRPGTLAAYDHALADCQGCPDELRLMQERARAAMNAGKLDDAYKRVQILLETHPKEQGHHLLMGEILQAKGDYPGARKEFEQEAALFPLEPVPVLDLGLLEMARDRPAEAEKDFRRAVAINPNNADALVLLAQVLSQSGQSEEADRLTEQALAIDPYHPGAHYHKAVELQRKGQREEALKEYQACLAGEPNNASAWFNLGTLMQEMGRNAEAENCYTTSIKDGKAPMGAYSNLGVLYAQAGKFADAIPLWERAIQMEPTNPAVSGIRRNIERARAAMAGGKVETGGKAGK